MPSTVTKEKRREYNDRWEAKNPDKVAARNKSNCEYLKKRYATDPEFREERKAYAKAHRAANADAIYAKRKASEKSINYDRTYNRRPDRRRALRDALFRQKYGITHDEYDALAESQNGKCAICGGDSAIDKWKSGLKNLQVDHCHDTGRVRGLLCFHCNTGLGHFRDNADLLEKALNYLKFSSR